METPSETVKSHRLIKYTISPQFNGLPDNSGDYIMAELL